MVKHQCGLIVGVKYEAANCSCIGAAIMGFLVIMGHIQFDFYICHKNLRVALFEKLLNSAVFAFLKGKFWIALY